MADVSLGAEVEAAHHDIVEVHGLGFDSRGGLAVSSRFPLALDAAGEGEAVSAGFLDEDAVHTGLRLGSGGRLEGLGALFSRDYAFLNEKIERSFVLGKSRNRRNGGSGD